MKMHCGKIISVAISFLKNASLPGLQAKIIHTQIFSSHMNYVTLRIKDDFNIEIDQICYLFYHFNQWMI